MIHMLMAAIISIQLLSMDSNEPWAESPLVANPNVVIIISEDRVIMDVQRTETTQITLNGVVTANVIWMPMVQYLVVSLTYTMVGGVVVGTSQVIFSKGIDSQPFECNVKMPMGVKFGEYNLSVSGTWRYSPGTITGPVQPDSATIEVPPYSSPIFYFPHREKTVKVGEDCEFTIWIKNKGNCDDNITIDYSFDGPVEVRGPSSIHLYYDENTTIVVRAKQTGGMPRANDIMIAVAGSNGGMSPSNAADIHLVTKMSPYSLYSVWLIIPLILIIIIVSGVSIKVWRGRIRSRVIRALR